MDLVNIREKLDRIDAYWTPHVVGELNGQQVKLAKVKGDFIWHHHEQEDELFLVLAGELTMEFRDRTITLSPGELMIVRRGVEHRPRAAVETHLLLFEPAGTLNTGNVRNELTKTNLKKI